MEKQERRLQGIGIDIQDQPERFPEGDYFNEFVTDIIKTAERLEANADPEEKKTETDSSNSETNSSDSEAA